MQRDAEFFGDQELELLYIAKRLNDALALEKSLTQANVDYLVETGTYLGGVLFKRELTGAFFYVAPSVLEQARKHMAGDGFKPYRED